MKTLMESSESDSPWKSSFIFIFTRNSAGLVSQGKEIPLHAKTIGADKQGSRRSSISCTRQSLCIYPGLSALPTVPPWPMPPVKVNLFHGNPRIAKILLGDQAPNPHNIVHKWLGGKRTAGSIRIRQLTKFPISFSRLNRAAYGRSHRSDVS